MATTIVPSDLAPSEVVHYSFAGVEFDLGGSGKGSVKKYETSDPSVVSNASVHPWLTVEAPSEDATPAFLETLVRPEDDTQGALGPNAGDAFDQEKIAAIEDAKAQNVGLVVAVDAGLDQGEEHTNDDGTVAETLRAADATDNAGDDS